MAQQPGPGQSTACHVYAADQGLQLQNETVDAVMFDDAALLLLVIKGGVMFAYDVAQDLPTQHEQLVWTYPLQEGPAVVCARCSLDRRLLALQRSRLLVEAVDLPTGNISVCSSDKGRSELLGMFFSEWPAGQLVLLSRGGLELCTLAASRQGLNSRDRLRLPVHWYQYSHETRCCLVATGPPIGPPYLQAWQFLSTGLVTLPPFTLSATALGTSPSVEPTAPAPGALPTSTADNLLTSGGAGPAAQPTSAGTGLNSGAGGGGGGGGGDVWPSLPVSTHATIRNTPGQRANTSKTSTAGSAAAQAGSRGAAGKSSDDAGWGSWTTGLATWVRGGGGGTGMAGDVLPGLAAAQLASWPNMTAGASMEVVPASAVHLLKMYGRVYCAHINAATRTLDLYRIFTDTVVRQHSFPLPSCRVALSVVDNVLVVHQQSICSAMLIDVCADGGAPVTSMQVLGHLAPLRRPRQLEEERLQQQRLKRQGQASAAAQQASALAACVAWSVVDEDGVALSCSAWHCHLPNLIVDMKTQVVYRLLLDLHAISVDCTSAPVLAAFLQRRRAPRLQVNALEVLVNSPLAAHAAVANLARQTNGSRHPSLELPATDAAPAPADQQPITPRGADATSGGAQAPGSTTSDAVSPGVGQEAAAQPHNLLHPVMLSGLVWDATTVSKLTVSNLAQRVLQDEVALPDLRKFYDAVVQAYREVVMSSTAGRVSPVAAACVMSPAELVQQLLAQAAHPDQLTATRRAYLQAASYELSAALVACDIEEPRELQLLTWQLTLPPAPGNQVASQAGCSGQDTCEGHGKGDIMPRVLHCTWQLFSQELRPADLLEVGGKVAAESAAAMLTQRAAAASAASMSKLPEVTYQSVGPAHKSGGQQQAAHTSNWAPGTPADTGSSPGQAAARSSPAPVVGESRGSGAQASGAAGALSSTDVLVAPGVHLVRYLLEQGQVIKAARAARDLRVFGVMPQELIAAAAKIKDVAVLAALYRCFRPALMPLYPTFDALRQAVSN